MSTIIKTSLKELSSVSDNSIQTEFKKLIPPMGGDLPLSYAQGLIKSKNNFDFYEFERAYNKNLRDKQSLPSKEFLIWFIGFFEGDGSLIVSKRGDLGIVVTQHTKDIQVLHMIQKNFGFGKVIKQGKTTSRFVVQDKRGLFLLAHLLNGNLVTNTKLYNFKIFLSSLNNYLIKGTLRYNPIQFKSTLISPLLTDSWLSGFTDAEGCFSVSINTNNNSYKILFDVAQKGELETSPLSHFLKLFGVGSIKKHYEIGCYYYRINGLNYTSKIFSYFDQHQLKTKKLISYTLWKQLHNSLSNNDHLDKALRPTLKLLATQVNNT